MKIDPNDQVYPTLKAHSIAPGLTIRAHFAAMAMQGFASAIADAQYRVLLLEVAKDRGTSMADLMATMALEHADALLAALNKEEQK